MRLIGAVVVVVVVAAAAGAVTPVPFAERAHRY